MHLIKINFLRVYSRIFLITIIISVSFALHSQKIIDLSTQISGNSEFVARDQINLLPGFKYSATSGNSMIARIDDNIISNTVYQTPYNPDNISLNKELSVGSIMGNADVDPSGAATYQIPIFCPPGTAGMQPSISIGYNSHGGNGIMGIGWNICGLSGITRVPQSYYNDNNVVGVNLSQSDRFALDGNRLIIDPTQNYNYGDDFASYITEINTFQSIVGYNGNGHGPTAFDVIDKNNSIYQYGAEDNSGFVLKNSNTVYAWMINRITDKNGNYIRYYYKQNLDENSDPTGEYYIEKIEYTGNDGSNLAPYNVIRFLYETRTDKNTTYVGGYANPEDLILRGIKVECNGKTVREYQFKYTLDIYSHLTEIIEIASDGKMYNSTFIKWGEETNEFSGPNTSNIEINPNSNINLVYHTFVGDFNGDGKDDICIANRPDNQSKFIGAYLDIYISNSMTGTSFDHYTNNLFDMAHIFIPDSSQVMDFNGDGKDDLLLCFRNTSGHFSNGKKYCYYPMVSTGTNFIHFSNTQTQTYSFYVDQGDVLVGDFDGNGRAECLIQYPDDSFSIIDYTKFENNCQGTNCGIRGSNLEPDKAMTLDFDGDGRTEIMTISSTLNWNNTNDFKIYSISSSGGNAFVALNSELINGLRLPGDYNGDNKSDFFIDDYLIQGNPGTKYFDHLNFLNGADYTSISINESTSLHNYQSSSPLDLNYYVGDFNGDGKDDILKIDSTSAGNFDLKVSYSIGNAEFHEETTTLNSIYVKKSYFSTGDFNGDGKKEVFYINSQDKGKFISFHKDEKKHLVESITNGLEI